MFRIDGKVTEQDLLLRNKITETLIEYIKTDSIENARKFVQLNEEYLMNPYCFFLFGNILKMNEENREIFDKLMMRFEILNISPLQKLPFGKLL